MRYILLLLLFTQSLFAQVSNPGSVPVPGNFSIQMAEPIDDRYNVNTIEDLPGVHDKYNGLITRVKSNGLRYEYEELTNTWHLYTGGIDVANFVTQSQLSETTNFYEQFAVERDELRIPYTQAGLVKTTIGANTGWRLYRADGEHLIGGIGTNAADLSTRQSSGWQSQGAQGSYSFAAGLENTASGERSSVFGSHSIASGSWSQAFGGLLRALSFAEVVVGYANNVDGYTPDAVNYNVADRAFTVGTGKSSGGPLFKNGFVVWKNDTAELPNATNANITARGNKAITTVEYVAALNNTKLNLSGGTISGNVIPNAPNTISLGSVSVPFLNVSGSNAYFPNFVGTSAAGISFFSNTFTQWGRFFLDGNLLIQTGGTPNNNNKKLQVTGQASVSSAPDAGSTDVVRDIDLQFTKPSYIAVSSAYTTGTARTIVATGTTTITLATTGIPDGMEYYVENGGTGTITVAVNGAGTIEGAIKTEIPTQWGGHTFIKTGANTYIIKN